MYYLMYSQVWNILSTLILSYACMVLQTTMYVYKIVEFGDFASMVHCMIFRYSLVPGLSQHTVDYGKPCMVYDHM